MKLPAMGSCTSCGECCTVATARPQEVRRIRRFMRENFIVWERNDTARCGFLRDQDDGTYRCAVYEARPFVCRAYGVIQEMKCGYFPEDATESLPADRAVELRLIDPADKLLGEVFEGPQYIEKLAGIVASEQGVRLKAGAGTKLLASMREAGVPVYGRLPGVTR